MKKYNKISIDAGSKLTEKGRKYNLSYKCPRCGGFLSIKENRAHNSLPTQFEGCSNYPRCKFTREI